ncbi:MAG: hypothetical protein CMH55_07460 [Myxococcales bacterium]|nr:hypothetical protein [Myxococcales bacterium]
MITKLFPLLLLVQANPSATHGELKPILQLLSSGQISQALQQLEPLARRYPEDPYVLGYLGRARLHAGDAQGAIQPLQRSLAKLPQDGEGHNNLGVALMQTKRQQEAVMSFARAAVRLPRSPQVLRNLAGAYTYLERKTEALQSWQQYLNFVPEDGEALCVVGGILLEKEKFREAAIALRKGSRLQKKDMVCLHDYADTLGRLGQAGEALSILNRVVRQDPKDAHAFYLRAFYLMEEEGALPQALASLDQALALKPKAPPYHHLHGYLLARMGQQQASLQAHERAAKLAPEREEFVEALALARVRAGQGKQVRKQLLRMNQKTPKNREVARALAEIHVQATDFKKGESVLRKAGLEDLTILKDLVWLYNEWNRPERALKLLERAEKSHPHDRSLAYNRALVLARLARMKEALTAAKKAQAQNPKSYDERFLYLRLLLEAGQAKEVIQKIPEPSKEAFALQLLRIRALRQNLRLADALKDIEGLQGQAAAGEQAQALRRLHGKILTDLGRGAEAVGLFRSPNTPASELGIALSRAGRAKEALQVLRQAQYQEGRDPELSLAIASAYDQVGRPDQALGVLSKAQKRWPGHGGVLNDLALLALRRGARREAKQLLTKGLKSDPSREGLVRNMVDLLIEEKRPKEAVAVAERALKHSHQLGRIHTSLGRALEASGQQRAAWKAYKAAVLAGTPDLTARAAMGDLERKNGRLLEAIEHYKAALKASPTLLVAYNGLGLSYHRLERWKVARTWYQKGLEHRANDPEINNNLGSTYYMSGRPQKAHRHFHRARVVAPHEPLYWRNEAMMLKHMERLNDSESLLKEALIRHPSDPGLRAVLKSLKEAREIKQFLRKD